MKGCIAKPDWEACKSCRWNTNDIYGCVIDISLRLEDEKFIVCQDYEEANEKNHTAAIWPNNFTNATKYNGPNRILRTLTTGR